MRQEIALQLCAQAPRRASSGTLPPGQSNLNQGPQSCPGFPQIRSRALAAQVLPLVVRASALLLGRGGRCPPGRMKSFAPPPGILPEEEAHESLGPLRFLFSKYPGEFEGQRPSSDDIRHPAPPPITNKLPRGGSRTRKVTLPNLAADLTDNERHLVAPPPGLSHPCVVEAQMWSGEDDEPLALGPGPHRFCPFRQFASLGPAREPLGYLPLRAHLDKADRAVARRRQGRRRRSPGIRTRMARTAPPPCPSSAGLCDTGTVMVILSPVALAAKIYPSSTEDPFPIAALAPALAPHFCIQMRPMGANLRAPSCRSTASAASCCPCRSPASRNRHLPTSSHRHHGQLPAHHLSPLSCPASLPDAHFERISPTCPGSSTSTLPITRGFRPLLRMTRSVLARA